MSYADQVFMQNIREILDHGVWDTDQNVRPHWEDGTPAHTIKKFGIVNRYDLQGITEEVLEEGIPTILSEPMVDEVYREEYTIPEGAVSFAIEYLPGQYDARADACEQCFQLLTGEKGVKVKCAKLIVIEGISSDELPAIKHYLINPVDSREASLEKPADLNDAVVEIKKVPVIEGFIGFTDEEVEALLEKMLSLIHI